MIYYNLFSCSHSVQCRWYICDTCVYCSVSNQAHLISFATRASVQSLSPASILSPSSMWRTAATENRYSFYLTACVNMESECIPEIKISAAGGIQIEPTTSDRLNSVLPLSYRCVNYIHTCIENQCNHYTKICWSSSFKLVGAADCSFSHGVWKYFFS